mmetsp:Transcript_6072/g.22995  ORF Transcript_6072/g.22995 Transcript_6072/m.22995 type:complete len:88 (+) Transcript_6072:1172-1435(+)
MSSNDSLKPSRTLVQPTQSVSMHLVVCHDNMYRKLHSRGKIKLKPFFKSLCTLKHLPGRVHIRMDHHAQTESVGLTSFWMLQHTPNP